MMKNERKGNKIVNLFGIVLIILLVTSGVAYASMKIYDYI